MKTPRVSFLVVVFLVSALTAWAGSGGPDADGYRWIDSREPGGPTYSWVEISPRCGGTGTLIAQGDDRNSGLVPILPSGGFRYRGVTYNSIAVCSNGWLSFSDGADTSHSGRIPDSLPPNNVLAPLWTDLYPVGGTYGSVYYLRDTLGGRNRTIVEWDSVAGFNMGTYYKLEVILDATNDNVFYEFKYSDNWTRTTASIGIENVTGKVGLGVSQSNIANSYAIKFYTDIPHNVGMARIVRPNTYEPPLSILVPNAWVKNFGTTTDTFPSYCRIDSAGTQIYLSQRQVTGLRGGDTLLVKFDAWTVGPDTNTYQVRFYTAHPRDPNPTNDTLKVTVNNHGQRGWLPPVNLGDSISTAYSEQACSMTGDENYLYLCSDRPGGQGGLDIWVAQRMGGVWRKPINLGTIINTSYDEEDPWISQDGNLLVFGSDRPGGQGGVDLWMAKKIGGIWQTPTNMGNVLNSSYSEPCPWMSSDTLRIYFTSDRPSGYGSWDIWMSQKSGGQWQPPTNLGPNINGSSIDAAPCLGDSEKMIYFQSSLDLWTSKKVSGQWQPKANLGPVINTGSREDRPFLSLSGTSLYFASDRPGGKGYWDLYRSDLGIVGYEEHYLPWHPEQKVLRFVAPKPNPASGPITFEFNLGESSKVTIKIYDLTGRIVKTLKPGTVQPGLNRIAWDGTLEGGGKPGPSGVYFYELSAGDQTFRGKITKIK